MQTPLQGAFRCVWMQNRVFLLMQAGGAIGGGKPGGEMSRPQDVRKRAAWERVHWERRYEEAGRWW